MLRTKPRSTKVQPPTPEALEAVDDNGQVVEDVVEGAAAVKQQ